MARAVVPNHPMVRGWVRGASDSELRIGARVDNALGIVGSVSGLEAESGRERRILAV
jgi:hypothetical protein